MVMSGSPSPDGILSVGLKQQLMRPRTAVLRSKGYVVLESFSIDDGLEAFRSIDIIDVAILCHSIPQVQQSKLATAMKAFRPLTPVLALIRGFGQVEAADFSLGSLSGPEELLDCVRSLLNKAIRGTRSESAHQRAPLPKAV
jgi:DNA-binding response OmpR family regulator